MAPPTQAYYILSRAPYEVKGKVKKFGITKLLDSGVYKAAYPLHDVSPVISEEVWWPSSRVATIPFSSYSIPLGVLARRSI